MKLAIQIIIIILLVILGIFAVISLAKAPYYNNYNRLKIVAAPPADLIVTEPASPPKISLLFGGDVMLSRVVGQKMVKYQDYAWPFKKIASTTLAADYFVVNLESPFTLNSKNYFVPTGSFSFNADPQSIAGLKLAGVDLVSLANNHILNQGTRGLTDTIKVLQENQIDFAGAGDNLTAAHQGVIKEIKGVKFGFLSYAYPDDNTVATGNKAGIANMDLALLKNDLSRFRPIVDVLIVIMHAGSEYTASPSGQQKQFAYAAISGGADLVVGHHPHWAQTTEIHQGKPIIYSLGNLVFDQMWSKETAEGALAEIKFSSTTLKQIKIIPVQIENYGQAEIATTAAKNILKRMGLGSDLLLPD